MEKETKHYRMLEQVGEREVGVLYKAFDTKLNELRTVQIVRTALAADPRFMAMFVQAARDLSRLNHPHILTTYWFFEKGPNPFLVMEYVDGVTLADVIQHSAPMRYKQALPLFKQVLAGLAYAHDKGICHRDLQPSSVLVTREGRVKITGFGLTRNPHGEHLTGGALPRAAVRYLSPEHVRSRDTVDACSDLYAVGAMLYEALSGRSPFGEEEEAFLLLRAIIEDEVVPLERVAPGVPEELAAIVMQALARNPADRFPSASAFRAALEDFGARAPTPTIEPVFPDKTRPARWQQLRSPLGYAAMLSALVATVVFGWWAFSGTITQSTLPTVIAVSQTDSLRLTTGIYEQVLPSVAESQGGTLVLQAFPYGDLYIGGKKVGADSVQVRLGGEQQQVACTHPVYGRQEALIEVGTGQRKEAICYFEAYLRVQATDEKGTAQPAELYVDNQATGRLAPLDQPYAIGPGTYTLEAYQPGYLGGVTAITVQPSGADHKIATPPVASLAFLLQHVD